MRSRQPSNAATSPTERTPRTTPGVAVTTRSLLPCHSSPKTPPMLLHNITLENFGAYRGRHTLDLTTKPGKPIVLIGGLNGCGKTTLLDAIQLALYGNRARCSGRGNRPYDAYL